MLCRFPLIQWHSIKCLTFYKTYRLQTNIYMNFLGVCCHTSMIHFRAINMLAMFFIMIYMFLLGLFPLRYLSPSEIVLHSSDWAERPVLLHVRTQHHLASYPNVLENQLFLCPQVSLAPKRGVQPENHEVPAWVSSWGVIMAIMHLTASSPLHQCKQKDGLVRYQVEWRLYIGSNGGCMRDSRMTVKFQLGIIFLCTTLSLARLAKRPDKYRSELISKSVILSTLLIAALYPSKVEWINLLTPCKCKKSDTMKTSASSGSTSLWAHQSEKTIHFDS